MKHETTHPPTETPAKGFSPGFAALGLEAALLTRWTHWVAGAPRKSTGSDSSALGTRPAGQAATGTGKTAAFTLCFSALPTSAALSLCAHPGADQSWPCRSAKRSRAG